VQHGRDAVGAWLNAAGRYPLLTAGQEVHLGQAVRTWLDNPEPTPQQIRRGRRAKERLICCNLRLVASRAKYFTKRANQIGIAYEDLLQEGTIGLNRAAELFDPARGYKFSTYASRWIDQAVRRVIDAGNIIRRPYAASSLLAAWYHRDPAAETVADFCERRGVTVQALRRELEHAARSNVGQLDMNVTPDGPPTALAELIAAPATETLDQIDLAAAVDRLRAAEPDAVALLELRSEGVSVVQLADLIGLTRPGALNRLERMRRLLQAVAGPSTRELVAG